jgi:SNF2 family DNA or RNA helicase
MGNPLSQESVFSSPLYSDFRFALPPYPYQQTVWERSRELKTFALFMEQGTGKTKVTADTAGWLYQRKLANLLIVVAPSGVHEQWVEEELPKHMSPDVPYTAWAWNTAAPKATDAMLTQLVHDRRLVVLAFNIEAVSTQRAKKWIQYFLQHRPGILTVDEATDIKRPSALRTRTLWHLGKFAMYRRILTGTPASEGPFGYYAMFRFLHWQILGYQTFAEFKADFAEWIQLRGWRDDIKEDSQGRPIMVVARDKAGNPQYKNLDRLYQLADKRSYRITKQDALPWLPPKQYDRRLFDLSDVQRKLYNEIKHEYVTEFKDKTYYAELAIVRLLRMQQIACGYLPSDTEEPHQLAPGPNPRIEALEALLAECSDQFIVWARFSADIDQIMKLLGKRAVRYDAKVDATQRGNNKHAFLAGDVQGFVGNAKAGGRGLNIQVASTMVFYSNYFDLEWRQQGEDRGHRPGMAGSLSIYDLCGRSTVDEYVIKRLKNKQVIADTITGDDPREWL